MVLNEFFIQIRYILERLFSHKDYLGERKAEFKYDMTFALTIRNEAEYVTEWIDWHKALFGKMTVHFHIFDNRSNDDLRGILKPYIKEGTASYTYVNAENHPQCQMYTHAVRMYANKSRLMAFIDTDEFIMPSDASLDIGKFVFERTSVGGGLVINWLCYGSSGHMTKPSGTVLESYLWRSEFSYEANKHVKTIVNPRTVRCFCNPHHPMYKRGCFAVDETGVRVPDEPFNENPEYTFVRLHHYAAKSKEEQERKVSRGYGKHSDLDKKGIRHNVHDKNDVYDPTALSVMARLRGTPE